MSRRAGPRDGHTVTDQTLLTGLLKRAFLQCPARDANAAIAEVRGSWGAPGRAVPYEVVLGEGRGWSFLRDSVAPQLCRFLRSKRMRVEACAPVFMPIFSGESLYFIGAEDFFVHYCAAESVDPGVLRARARVWEDEAQ